MRELPRWASNGSEGVILEMPEECELHDSFYVRADQKKKRASTTQAPPPTNQSGNVAITWKPPNVAVEYSVVKPERVFGNPIEEVYRALNVTNNKASWMTHNLMPPYSIDCPVWIDIRALDSIEPREAMGALHEPLLRGEESPLN